MAQSQIEAALRTVLMPLAHAREAHLRPRQSTASTSKQPDNAAEALDMAVDEPEQVEQISGADQSMSMDPPTAQTFSSKRAQKRAKAAARIARREAAGPLSTHEMTLKSGRVLRIPNYVSPDKFEPKLLLDKGKAKEDRPEISQDLILGINAVTRALENEVYNGRRQLAGLPEAKSPATEQNSLRFTVHAPTKYTRRQRRELREDMDPDAKRARLRKIAGRKKKEHQVPPFEPAQHALVPRDEPALLHALAEAKEDAGKVDPTIQGIRVMERIVQGYDGQGCKAVAERDRGEPIKISLDAINNLLALREITAATKGILQYLFLRFIPGRRAGQGSRPSPLGSQPVKPINDPAARDGVKEGSASRENLKRAKDGAVAAAEAPHNPAKAPLTAVETGSAAQKSAPQRAQGSAESKGTATGKFERPANKPVRIIFVARGDINPPSIVQHLLVATAARNSVLAAQRRQLELQKGENDSGAAEDVYLVPMGSGFEHRLCELLAVRRAAVLAISVGTTTLAKGPLSELAFQASNAPGFETLLQLLKHHLPRTLSADWLIPAVNGIAPKSYAQLHPTHIKQLSVEVPIDPRAARTVKKAKRAEGKASRKRRREEYMKASSSGKKLRRQEAEEESAVDAAMELISTQA